MRDCIRRWILFLFIALGLGVINYPFISQSVNMRYEKKVVSGYERDMDELSGKEKEQFIEEARAYNARLAESAASKIQDAFLTAVEMDETYETLLNADENGVMGYLSVPKINVYLPIYHGTSVRVLESGIGHLEGSSLPVGGESTHSVLCAHNGLPSKLLFTDLDQLVEGDYFYLYVFGEKMAYEVDQILTVRPEETEALQITKGQDYVTLMTCTPYGVNSHRYFVRGYQVPWNETAMAESESIEQVETIEELQELQELQEQQEQQEQEKTAEQKEAHTGVSQNVDGKWEMGKRVYKISLVAIVVTAIVLFFPRSFLKKKNKNEKQKAGSK